MYTYARSEFERDTQCTCFRVFFIETNVHGPTLIQQTVAEQTEPHLFMSWQRLEPKTPVWPVGHTENIYHGLIFCVNSSERVL